MTSAELLQTKWEWMVTGDWNRLHYVPADRDEEWLERTSDGGMIGRSACGREALWELPGILSRLGRPRCAHCCREVGIPRGDGCPVNDETLNP